MKVKQVRHGVFETNSSSTHSLTMCSAEDFKKFEDGELMWDSYNDALVKQSDDADNEDFQTYEQFFEDDYLESFEESYTTKSGDEIVAFGKYGRDG